METSEEAVCTHIAQLPAIPTQAELEIHRKSRKKIKVPNFKANDFGGHAALGQFFVKLEGDLYFEWNIVGMETKRYPFADLCERSDLEMERLELGWLIGNIYRLNKIHDLERRGVPYDEATQNERARVSNWYEKREAMWYRWGMAAPHGVDGGKRRN